MYVIRNRSYKAGAFHPQEQPVVVGVTTNYWPVKSATKCRAKVRAEPLAPYSQTWQWSRSCQVRAPRAERRSRYVRSVKCSD